jgi:hypothetical protein
MDSRALQKCDKVSALQSKKIRCGVVFFEHRKFSGVAWRGVAWRGVAWRGVA